ncbi:response regulator [Adlercreutzia sp. ZJ141]|uniref:response regulator n=1 Tax=Adlercreutzia sp. ZJ141 TaxID=2709406 RepID=UPI0013EDEDCA|nr:response regulator transcription factor [Adlercreutzia sp. ZJ141]
MKVIIVDDDPFITESLSTILNAENDIDVIERAHGGAQAIERFAALTPDVLLMDIQMPGTDGLAAAEAILREQPCARIVFLTTFSDDEYIVRALQLGARGYLIKQDAAKIAPALRSVMAGQSVLAGDVVERASTLLRRTPTSFSHPNLTERECAIVEKIAEGLDNRQIATALYLGEGTVRNHISVILQKLTLKNRTQIAIFYFQHQ